MLASVPWGTAGLAILAAGFGILGSLAYELVNEMVPTIEKMAAIKIPDPETFAIVSTAIINLIDTTGRFAQAIGDILEAVKPTAMDAEAGDTMSENIKLVTGLVDSFMKNGVVELMKQMVELSKTKIPDNAIKMMESMGGILQAIGTLASSFAGADMSQAEHIDNDEIHDYVDAQARFADKVGPKVMTMLDKLKSTFFNASFIGLLRKMKIGSSQKSTLGEIAPLIQTAVSFTKSLQPGDAMKAMQHVDNDDSEEFVGALAEYAKKVGPVIQNMLPYLTKMIEGVVNTARTYMTSIPADIDAEKIQAAADLMSAVMMGTAAGAAALSKTLGVMGGILAADNMDQAKKDELIEMLKKEGVEMFDRIGSAMKDDMGPAINKMLTALDAVVLTQPEMIDAKMKAIAGIMQAVAQAADMFGRHGKLSSVTRTQMAHEVSQLLRAFSDKLLGRNGTIAAIASKIEETPLPSAIRSKVESINEIVDSTVNMGSTMEKFQGKFETMDMSGMNEARQNFNTIINTISGAEFIRQSSVAQMDKNLKNAAVIKRQADDLTAMLNSIATVAEGLPDITMEVDGMADAASIVKEFSEVKDRPVAITVTLNVRIDAEALATVLTDTPALKAKFK